MKRRPVTPDEARLARELAGLTNEELAADGFMRAREAAEFLGLSRSQIYELMNQGPLPYRRLGAARMIPRVAIQRWSALGIVRRDRVVADAA